MSQSAPWQTQDLPNAQGAGVQFYDPTKFQATATNNVDQAANGQNNQAGASNSWNSWGNSWADNSVSTNQGYSEPGVNAQGQGVVKQPSEGEHVQSQVIGQQPGNDSQYYNQWHQSGWDPNNPQQNWDPNTQQNWDPNTQQHWDPNSQKNWNPNTQQNWQLSQGNMVWDGQQWVNSQQTWPTSQQVPAAHTGNIAPPVVSSAQEHQPSLSNSNTSGQFYEQTSPETSGNFSHSSASFFSQSVGLNDSTSSSLDQSSSSHHLDPSGSSQSDSSALVADDSTNTDGGTVSGFFGKDDGDSAFDGTAVAGEPKLTSVPQYLNVNPEFHRTDSAISNASMQTVNYSSHGSIGSMEEIDNKDLVQNVTNQFQNVSLGTTGSGMVGAGQPGFPPVSAGNMNQNAGGKLPPSAFQPGMEDEQTGNLNDWEIVPNQPGQVGGTGANFFIGGSEEVVSESVPNLGQNLGMNQPEVNTSGVSITGPPMSSSGQQEAPLYPPPAGSPAGGNPFRKSPRNVQRNASNQSLPSLQGDVAVAGQPVVFSPDNHGNFTVQHSAADNMSSFPGDIPRPVSSSEKNMDPRPVPVSAANIDARPITGSVANMDVSAFKPPVPTYETHTNLGSVPEGTSSNTDAKQTEVISAVDTIVDSGNKPPAYPGRSAPSSPRKHTSAFHPVSHRAKHSMSPATTLWDNIDAPATNIILAPAAPMLVGSAAATTAGSPGKGPGLPVIPVQASLENKLKDSKGKGDNQGNDRKEEHQIAPDRDRRSDRDVRGGSDRYGRNERSRDDEVRRSREDEARRSREHDVRRSREDEVRSREDEVRKKEEDNRSINSLEELDAQIDYRDRDEYRDRRYKDRYGYRDRDPRYDRPASRGDSYNDDSRRHEVYKSRDYREPYRRDGYYGDERYERPRSRQEEERPGSRSGVRDVQERSRSRTDYDKDAYYKDKYGRGYDYDYYNSRSSRYYDDRYYQYYQRDARYSQGYYDEYYGHGYNPRYSEYYSSQYGGGTEVDRYSQHSQSRGHTPALDDVSQSGEYYQGNGSRSSSRQGQDDQKAYARHSYDYDYGYDNYGYGYDYDPNYGYYYGDPYQQETPGRMTPQKHTIPHVRASFGANGQLIKVLPNRPGDGQPATVEVHNLEEALSDNRAAEDLREFPGPLTRADTHKNDVLQFCQRKAQSCAENINMVDRDSAELIWRLLELLIKQNGSVVGTDIADLLLEGHEPTSVEYSMMGMKITQSTEELDKVGEDETAGVKVTSDRSQINRGRSLEEITDRFRSLLSYGRKKDALEWATKNNLWGHALFLASKMDTRTHASVMIRFANSAMKINDPLQTLYQLMSGRQPAAVTCVVDERWGDWRPHLAMILSNSSSKPELDRKSIATLGDTMAAKGCLHASHFCYIMAQSGFGTYSKKTSKIVLVGSSHNWTWEEFATNEAIQCTEIYEYAQSLGNQTFLLPHFQVYKFLYASRLAEFGFLQEALHYCEVISTTVQSAPAYFQPAFVKVLYEFSNRLKFYDPQRVHSGEDEDQAWLQQLQGVCLGYDDGSIQPVSGNATPAMFGGTTASSESGDVYGGTAGGEYTAPQYHQDPAYQQYGQDQAYQQYGQNQQQLEYQQSQQQAGGQHSQPYTAETHDEQTVEQTQQMTEQQNQSAAQWQNQYGYNYGYQTGEQQTGANSANQNTGYNTVQQTAAETANQNTGYNTVQQTDGQTSQMYGGQVYNQQYNQGFGQDYTGSDRLASQRGSVVSAHSVDTEGDHTDGGQDMPAAPSSSFDYFGAATQTKIVAPPSRFRTTSTSSSTGGGRQRTVSESSTGSVKAASSSMKKSVTDSNVKKNTALPGKKEQPKKSSGGWFGGWFNKPKNKDMHLPKDDKPAIVWDAVNKKWINTDGEEEDEKPALPPPKDTELMGNSTGPPSAAPAAALTAAGPTSAGAPPSGNRFSRNKGRGARNQYVDVLSSKTTPAATVPSTLFNVMPTAAPTTNTSAQIFNPTGSVSTESSQPAAPSGGESVQSNLLEPPSGEPQQQHYNYNNNGHSVTDSQLSRSSSMSSLSREVQQFTTQPDSAAGATTNPILFNPAQFQGAQPQVQQPAAATNRPRYGQRRQYPKKT
ncbi:protein transport protein Sec16A-like isoform X2 [Haliotis cracherodii]|uniref:protein transport protein Sec16A-like isoform X2 n=1 Tax=Haliotis cracherodii TaxID=6455 RepID=UPI0039E98C0C